MKSFIKRQFSALFDPKTINIWILFASVEAFTILLFSILKPPTGDVHIATIVQSTVLSLGIIFTVISLTYLNKTAREIRNQSEASQRQAKATSDLLTVELERDKQSNLISGYLKAHAMKNKSSRDLNHGRYYVTIDAHINNQSLQPISRVTAKLYKNPRVTNPSALLIDEDIPISVTGPREDRSIDISDSFHSPDLMELAVDLSKEAAERLANSVEIEYSIQLTFRGADGKWYAGNTQNSAFSETNEIAALSTYTNAIDNYVKKKAKP